MILFEILKHIKNLSTKKSTHIAFIVIYSSLDNLFAHLLNYNRITLHLKKWVQIQKNTVLATFKQKKERYEKFFNSVYKKLFEFWFLYHF